MSWGHCVAGHLAGVREAVGRNDAEHMLGERLPLLRGLKDWIMGLDEMTRATRATRGLLCA